MAPVWRSAFFLLAAVVVAVKEGGSGQSPLTVRTQGFNAEGCGWVLDDEKFKNFFSMTVHHRVTLDLMETPAVSALGAFVDDQLRGLSEVASRPPFGPFKDKKVYVMDIYGVPSEKIEYRLCAGLFFPRVFNDVKNITMNSAKVFATNATIGSLASPNELTFSSVPVPPPGSPPPPPNPPPNPPPPLPSPPPPPSPHPPPPCPPSPPPPPASNAAGTQRCKGYVDYGKKMSACNSEWMQQNCKLLCSLTDEAGITKCNEYTSNGKAMDTCQQKYMQDKCAFTCSGSGYTPLNS